MAAALFLGADGMPDASLFVNDQLHLNAQGYALWTKALAPILQKALTSPARPATSREQGKGDILVFLIPWLRAARPGQKK